MNVRQRVLKTVSLSMLTVGTYFPASLANTLYLYHKKDPDIEKYVKENLEEVIKKQEEKLGISYHKQRPQMQYTLPEEFGFILPGPVGLYIEGKNKIYLPSGLLTNPKWDFSDFMATIATFNNTIDVKRVLDHELAHFYCDKLKEKILGKGYVDSKIYQFLTEEEFISDRLINEGIAEYVEKKMNGENEKLFSFETWPKSKNQFSSDVIYRGGYVLVKPIINRYKNKGIEFLLLNPPSPKELYHPKEYQEKVLADIKMMVKIRPD